MRFFCNGIKVQYPDDAKELRSIIISDATDTQNPQSQTKAKEYFVRYFERKGGDEIHPKLGDLSELVQEINSNWNNSSIPNPVSEYILKHVGNIKLEPDQLMFELEL